MTKEQLQTSTSRQAPATLINGYVLPRPAGPVAVVDCDLHRLSVPSQRVRLAIYGPRPLSPGESAMIRNRFIEEVAGSAYTAFRVARVLGLVVWWTVLALLAAAVLALRTVDLGPPGIWAAAILVGSSLPFGSGLGLQSWRAYRLARLAAHVREVEIEPGEQPAPRERVEELWRQYPRLSGREVEVVRRLEDACRDARWRGPAEFYASRRAWLEAGTGRSSRAVGIAQRLWRAALGPPLVPRDIYVELPVTAGGSQSR